MGQEPASPWKQRGPTRLPYVVSLTGNEVRRIEYQVGRRFRSDRKKPVLREFIEDLALPRLERDNPYLSRPATREEVATAVEHRSIQ